MPGAGWRTVGAVIQISAGDHLNATCAAACPALPEMDGCAPIDGVCMFPDPLAASTFFE